MPIFVKLEMLTIGPHPNMQQDIGAIFHNSYSQCWRSLFYKYVHATSNAIHYQHMSFRQHLRETCKIYQVMGQSTTLQIVQRQHNF